MPARARDVEPNRPVLVGVGTAFDDVEPAELMARAARRAGDDAGAPSLLRAVERIAVPRGTWAYTDPARLVAERIDAPGARTVLADLGIPQQTVINEVLLAIQHGGIDVGLVVGAEAKARTARAARRSTRADAEGIATVLGRATRPEEALETDQHGTRPDVHQVPDGEIVAQPEVDARLWAPVEQYALIESALGAATGRTLADQRREIAELWARFNQVARTNPEAAFPAPRTAEELLELGPGNRPLAFPYGKWHASQWTVDQGAALLLCSADAATRAGVPPDRWIHPIVGLDSSFALPLTRRRELHRWPAMRVLGDAATRRLGRPLATCEHVELYSCFPAAVRVQQRELGLDPDGTPTITGGMTFAGGPFNSFVLHATAAMARRLRAAPGAGLVTTVSGLLTKPGLAVWSDAPDRRPPLVADLHRPAAQATDTVEVLDRFDGPGVVAASTVTYRDGEPAELIAVVRTPGGAHAIARSDDEDLVRRSLEESLVGTSLHVGSGRALG